MPSHSAAAAATACLLALLGVALASRIPQQYVPERLQEMVKSIEDELDLKHRDIGSNRLFGAVIKSINSSCQKREDIQVMNATLNVYLHIFSSMEAKEETSPSVRKAVSYMQELMKPLQNRLNRLSHHRENLLSRLNQIKVDDQEVQRKALAEVMEIYQAVSVVTVRSHCEPQ